MKRTVIPGLLLVVFVLACAGGNGAGSVVRDSAGVAIVDNGGRGAWGAGDAWRFDEVLRIGTAQAEPHYQFRLIVSLAVDRTGNIYVLDGRAQHVNVYNASGKYLRTVGSPGNDPGELSRHTAAILVGRGDTVFVVDPLMQRVDRYAPDGSYAGAFRVPRNEGLGVRWELTERNTLLQQVVSRSASDQPRAGPQYNLILERSTDGTIQDTVMHLTVSEAVQFNASRPQARLFAPEAVWTLLPGDRIASGINDKYRIEIRGLDGELKRVIIRPTKRKRVSDADRQAMLKAMRESLERTGTSPQAASRVSSLFSIGDYYPAIGNMLAGPDNSLWVQQIRTVKEADAEGGGVDASGIGSPAFDVFDADGRLLGTVTFPDRFTPMRFVGETVYGTWRDDMDLEYVMVLARRAVAH